MGNIFNRGINISIEEDYLNVVSEGERSLFSEVLINAEKIHKAIEDSGKHKLLLDYSQTVFKLAHIEAFNILKVFELKLKEFKKVKMAVIINPRTEDIGSFWASLCQKRGFDFMVFQSKKKAKEWLLMEEQ